MHDSGLLIVAGAVLSLALVLLADLGVLTWIRRRVGMPRWLRRWMHIPPATTLEQAQSSVDAATDAPSAHQIYLTTMERLLNTQVATNDALIAVHPHCWSPHPGSCT